MLALSTLACEHHLFCHRLRFVNASCRAARSEHATRPLIALSDGDANTNCTLHTPSIFRVDGAIAGARQGKETSANVS
eukprot:4033482-Pyramimonas_sp.AAC.1